MSTSYITKKLLEMNDNKESLTKEEVDETIKDYESETELDIHSPEFLKQT